MTAKEYLDRIHQATGTKLIDGHPLYSGEDGTGQALQEMRATTESLKWWVVGVCMATIVAIAAMAVGVGFELVYVVDGG